MLSSKLILISLLIASGVDAQSQIGTGRISQTDLGRIYEARNLETRSTPAEQTTCLMRKSTHRSECRTRDQWARVARDIASSKAENR